MKWWSRRVTLPHELACRASAFLLCHDPDLNIKCIVHNEKCRAARYLNILHCAFFTLHLKQAALVLPQAGCVLETRLHELVRGLFKWRVKSEEGIMVRI